MPIDLRIKDCFNCQTEFKYAKIDHFSARVNDNLLVITLKKTNIKTEWAP